MVLRLTIGYDGTGFWGSQRQVGVRTVQEELESALERLGNGPVRAELAGRTDRGVHAVGQVARCTDTRPGMPEAAFQKALNRLLPDDIAVSAVERAPEGFHPRYDAIWREYRYRLWVGSKQPLAERYAWTRWSDLDWRAMAEGASHLLGTHDLAAFTGGGEGVPWSERAKARRGTTRTITHCSVHRVDGWWGTVPGSGYGLEIRIVADGFLPQLVRTVTGALVAVGQHGQNPDWIRKLIGIADRRAGPALAPAHGLILWRVGYGNDVPDPDPEETKHVSAPNARPQHG
jgi:tRNA pseudouridine38-40 synthase